MTDIIHDINEHDMILTQERDKLNKMIDTAQSLSDPAVVEQSIRVEMRIMELQQAV